MRRFLTLLGSTIQRLEDESRSAGSPILWANGDITLTQLAQECGADYQDVRWAISQYKEFITYRGVKGISSSTNENASKARAQFILQNISEYPSLSASQILEIMKRDYSYKVTLVQVYRALKRLKTGN